MRFGAIFAGLIGAAVLVGAAGAASAQTASGSAAGVRARVPVVSLADAQAAQRNTAAPQRRGLRWNDNGRWGLNFNLNQPVGRETQWGDVEAGAFYSVTPRLRVGAAAGLGNADQDPARAPESDRRSQPRIRLESLFKF